jgi:y4mF family transcriptional regulator
VTYSPADIGNIVRQARKALGVTQRALALTSGTGLRFIVELEKGKKTCEVGKVLTVLHTLGVNLTLTLPASKQEGSRDGSCS